MRVERDDVAAQQSCNELPGWLARVRARFPGFSARYLELDPRSLGLARIYIGCVLLLEVARHVPSLATFYTDEGLLPRGPVLEHGGKFLFSIFFLAPHLLQARLLLALCALVFALLALGKYTRVVHPLAFLCLLSLHARTPMFDDGSEMSMRLLVFWTMFLPMGTCFSLDARQTQRSRAGAPSETRPVVSLAVLAILLQLAVIYFFNAKQKDGATWREGSTIHYILHQDRVVTWLGWKLRPYVTPAVSAVMTWSALAIETVLPVLLMSPFKTKLTRRLAIALAVGLHGGIALLLNLGLFSAVMFGFFMLLLSDRDWDVLSRSELLRRLQAGTAVPATRMPAPPGRRWLRVPRWLPSSAAPAIRETLVVLWTIVLAVQLLRDNRVPPRWRPHRPSRVERMLIEYPRLHERWSMFAPEAPTGDFHILLVARTADRRLIDPFNEVASRIASTPLNAIPERLGQDDVYCDYEVGISDRRELDPALKDWVFRYDQRTGNPNDRITSFSLFTLNDDSPPPGETQPRNVRKELVFHVRRPRAPASN